MAEKDKFRKNGDKGLLDLLVLGDEVKSDRKRLIAKGADDGASLDDVKAYTPHVNVDATIKQIVADMKQKDNEGTYSKYTIMPNDLSHFYVKMSGDTIVFGVNETAGGYRIPEANVVQLQKRMKEVQKRLDKRIKEVRKEFKERAGKALRLSEQETYGNWELIASNGLYRFHAFQTAQVAVELPGQQFSDED